MADFDELDEGEGGLAQGDSDDELHDTYFQDLVNQSIKFEEEKTFGLDVPTTGN